jgi:hypothetical protein
VGVEMKLRELKEKINRIDDKFLDCEVQVDTEAAEFTCHLVDITGIYTDDGFYVGRDMVYITLDNSVKVHLPNDSRKDNTETSRKIDLIDCPMTVNHVSAADYCRICRNTGKVWMCVIPHTHPVVTIVEVQ